MRPAQQPGGLSSQDQTGVPTNPPEALRTLLQHWKTELGDVFADGFESGDTSAWSSQTEGSVLTVRT